jgi:hypothetical protein
MQKKEEIDISSHKTGRRKEGRKERNKERKKERKKNKHAYGNTLAFYGISDAPVTARHNTNC